MLIESNYSISKLGHKVNRIAVRLGSFRQSKGNKLRAFKPISSNSSASWLGSGGITHA